MHGFEARRLRRRDSPEIKTEGVYGEPLSQRLLVNVVFMTDHGSKRVPRRMKEWKYPKAP